MAEQTVLIVDSEPASREAMELTLLRMGLNTITANNVQDACNKIGQYAPDFCLADMQFPDGSSLDVVNFLQKQYPHIPLAVLTANVSLDAAIAVLKAGAFDFVPKPVDMPKLRELIKAAQQLVARNHRQKDTGAAAGDVQESSILGNSPVIQQLKLTIAKLARSQAPVYIHGESGSGKERVAHEIHLQSPRQAAPFIPVNCGAIPENLMESEFFGHKKGSFTGAVTDKQGLFQAAHKGTLFLDEVADLPLTMQVKLLRAIQEKAVKPVGGLDETRVDVRILSATHKNLENEVIAGRFRQDLYYRLNVIKLDVPALRERGSDILLLADFFLGKIARAWQMPPVRLSDAARRSLSAYDFPGNVRELENILERACTLCNSQVIETADLYLQALRLDAPTFAVGNVIAAALQPKQAIESEELRSEDVWNPEDENAEKDLVFRALDYTHWNRTRAARILGMTFRQLTYRIQKYSLDQECA